MTEEIKKEKAPSRRHLNRVSAIQYLYSYEFNKPENLMDGLRCYFEEQEQGREFHAFSEELVNGTIEHIEEIDEKIRSHAANWDFKRIAKVDLAILRLAIYELLYRNDIPPIVSINEAIDLSKEFSAEDSRRFINGILDKICSSLKRPSREAKV